MKLPLRQLMSAETRSFLAPAGLCGPFERRQVRVALSSRFNRSRHPDARAESALEATWAQYLRESPRLFNASKFRLAAWRQEEDGALRMDWGITDYKTYLGTCCSTESGRLLEDGEEEGDRFKFVSRKIGVAAVVETSDEFVALIKRSNSVGLYQNLHDTPGGHPEPSNVGLTAEMLDELEGNGDELRAMEVAARDELFSSIVNEVHEEVNIALEDMSEPLLLGVVLQTEACTPSFSFYVQTSRTAEEVQALYRAGPKDKFESQQLDLINARELLDTKAGSTTPLDRLELTPSARGTLSLWQEYKRLVGQAN